MAPARVAKRMSLGARLETTSYRNNSPSISSKSLDSVPYNAVRSLFQQCHSACDEMSERRCVSDSSGLVNSGRLSTGKCASKKIQKRLDKPLISFWNSVSHTPFFRPCLKTTSLFTKTYFWSMISLFWFYEKNLKHVSHTP